MKHFITILILFFTGIVYSQDNQQVNFGNNTPKNRTEWYRPNSPTNTVGNREAVGWIKSWDLFEMQMDTIRFPKLNSSVNKGLPTGVVWVDSNGNLKHSPISELIIPYSQINSSPTIPIDNNQLTNGSGFITQGGARTAITLTTTGSGAATYNNSSGLFNIPTNTGTVSSIGITGSDFSISGSPVTSSGNIALSLSTTGVTAGSYGKVTVDTKGRVSAGKRQEIYTGTTNASGVYSVTFGTAFSVTPNIQANIVGGTPNQFIVMTRATTGFTCTVYQRSSVTLLAVEVLLAATTLVNGATVDVIITEN